MRGGRIKVIKQAKGILKKNDMNMKNVLNGVVGPRVSYFSAAMTAS